MSYPFGFEGFFQYFLFYGESIESGSVIYAASGTGGLRLGIADDC